MILLAVAVLLSIAGLVFVAGLVTILASKGWLAMPSFGNPDRDIERAARLIRRHAEASRDRRAVQAIKEKLGEIYDPQPAASPPDPKAQPSPSPSDA